MALASVGRSDDQKITARKAVQVVMGCLLVAIVAAPLALRVARVRPRLADGPLTENHQVNSLQSSGARSRYGWAVSAPSTVHRARPRGV
jgi:hypothetical protein